MSYQILHGDCLEVLRTLADESVQCCVTSPPYIGIELNEQYVEMAKRRIVQDAPLFNSEVTQ